VSVLYLVVPLAIVIAAITVGAFVWAAKRGQFDDLTTPALRALQDDSEVRKKGAGSREQEPRGEARASGESGNGGSRE